MTIHPNSEARFKARVREITSRTRGVSPRQMMAELAAHMRGWGGYYAPLLSSARSLADLDSWCRRRVRQYQWVQWKTPGKRCRMLIRGGVNPIKARKASYAHGNWGPSHSPALNVCLTNARLAASGFVSLVSLMGTGNTT